MAQTKKPRKASGAKKVPAKAAAVKTRARKSTKDTQAISEGSVTYPMQ